MYSALVVLTHLHLCYACGCPCTWILGLFQSVLGRFLGPDCVPFSGLLLDEQHDVFVRSTVFPIRFSRATVVRLLPLHSQWEASPQFCRDFRSSFCGHSVALFLLWLQSLHISTQDTALVVSYCGLLYKHPLPNCYLNANCSFRPAFNRLLPANWDSLIFAFLFFAGSDPLRLRSNNSGLKTTLLGSSQSAHMLSSLLDWFIGSISSRLSLWALLQIQKRPISGFMKSFHPWRHLFLKWKMGCLYPEKQLAK